MYWQLKVELPKRGTWYQKTSTGQGALVGSAAASGWRKTREAPGV